MNMLKKRSTAVGVLVAVFLLGTLFGTHRSLSSIRKDTQEAFYVGVDDSGYGIQTNLKLRVEYARNLCKIASRYDAAEETQAVEDACTDLESAQTADEKYAANNALTGAVTDLSDTLAAQSLSDEDESYRKSLTADLSSYEMRIDKLATAYNTEVRTFNDDILGSIPGGVIGKLTGVRELEAYA
jgi:hypothetical protein